MIADMRMDVEMREEHSVVNVRRTCGIRKAIDHTYDALRHRERNRIGE